MITDSYRRELAITETEYEDINLGGGLTATIISEPHIGGARDQLQFLFDLLEQHRPVIKAAEWTADTEGWRCPDCGQLLSAHEASWNAYAFQWNKPLDEDNEPLLMWDSWQGSGFHIAANWTPSSGVAFG